MAIFYTSVDGKIYATGISIEEIESEVKILNFFLQDFDLKGTPKEQRLQARKAYNAMFAKDPENDEQFERSGIFEERAQGPKPCHMRR